MTRRIKVGVLISGTGTNLQALIDACQSPNYPAEIVVVISNNANAMGIQRAQESGIKAKIVEHENYTTREEFDSQLSVILSKEKCELICLAGFMRILSEDFVNRWGNRILNIHPSLLPSFPGTKTHERALEAGVKISGCTLHFVTAALDAGPIIGQVAVPVFDSDSPHDLANRVLAEEHKLYSLGLKLVANKLLNKGGIRIGSTKRLQNGSLLNFSTEI